MSSSTSSSAVLESPAMTEWRSAQDLTQAGRYRKEGWWRDRTFLDDIFDRIEAHPDKAALVSYRTGSKRPHTLTFGQMGIYIDRCAGALIELGVEPGDVVSMQQPNGWECTIMMLAAMRAGAIANPIPIIYRELQLAYMLRNAASKVLLVPPEFRGFGHAELALKLQKEIPTLKHVVCTYDGAPGLIDFETFFLDKQWELSPGLKKELNRRSTGPDDLSLMLYTSGTTGVPKAAAHTQNSTWAAVRAIDEALQLHGDDVCFMASTMGHMTGSGIGTMLPLSQGQKVVYQDIWDPDWMVDLIDAEQLTWTLSSTAFAVDLIEAQKKAKRPHKSFRGFICGGAPIPPVTAINMKEHLDVELLALWGATEFGICTIHRRGMPLEVLTTCDGMPLPWTEVRLVDEDLNHVAQGEEGRLQVRGASIFVGYYNQPELTADIRTRDGWFDTGDLGRMTPEKGIRISGRSKDLVIRGGENVPVVEVENELLKHPNVLEVAVVAVPDPRLGERGCAVVVPRGAAPSLDELKRHLEAAGMAKPFWPERLEIVKEMPRTAIGKIQKYVLRERLAAGKPLSE